MVIFRYYILTNIEIEDTENQNKSMELTETKLRSVKQKLLSDIESPTVLMPTFTHTPRL